MNRLLTISGLIETGAGLALLGFPALAVKLLFGAVPVEPALVILGRMGGAALLALGVACWLARGDTSSYTARGLVAGMLIYNVAVVGLFTYAALGLGLNGGLLWPAVGLHTVMAGWCLAVLGCRQRGKEQGTGDPHS